MKMRAPVLTEAERLSGAWKTIKDYAEQRIALLREKNDKNLDPVKTAQVRGALSELKNLAALDQPAPQTEVDDAVA